LAWPAAGGVLGLAAGAFGGWIVVVATRLARLPVAAVEWSSGAWSLLLLTGVCLVFVLVAGSVLRRRGRTVVCSLILLLVMVRPLPGLGWPPDGWVLVACDVGQGDALVLNAGGGVGVLVDAGPDPRAVDRCLDRLGVRRLAVVVLSHFHADHVDGLPGVLDARAVGEVQVTALREPASGADAVERWAASAGIPVRTPAYGDVARVGQLTWQLVGPPPGPPVASAGSAANNASLVLLVQTRGIRILASGDVEPEAQARLADALPGLRVDVLKIPHHGSRHQDHGWLRSLDARLAVVSVGEDNDYGHPSPVTLDLVRRTGAAVARTDEQGDVAVVVGEDGRLSVTSS
jgi:competence protein ComEC